MSAWQEFLTLTKELDEVIHQPVSEKNRANVLDRVDVLLDKRQALMGELTQPTSDQERAVIEEVKKRDLKINQKLEFLFTDLKKDMRNNKKQKSSKQRYTNPYQSVSNYDGMFFDHKK
ncbi:flagellar protein FliT [Halobacillus sp. BBL2006]|uniref:flagellar protein FliT n=1 Tax=Halobacillus sp. BBL2006 TaxID=1543706 RepID=UPI000542117B|nr:flagellar protein FliT [Halobacillus sp. BBL2006]KHE67542.1 flagellar protein [Halobacillus sp. BBL2006]